MNDLVQLPEFSKIWQESLQWQPSQQQQVKFQHLYEEIILGNCQLNLTRITESKDFWEKHIWDSLSGVISLDLNHQSLSVIDIGTGGGFPGIPVAVTFPSWTVTLLDSVEKKMIFLKNLLSKIQVENATVLMGRAEAIGQSKKYRETYDISLIRAVASSSICAEYGLPLLKLGGVAILYRGHWSHDEALSLEAAVSQLGGEIEEIKKFITPLSESIRHCVYVRKISPTPKKYPRAVGIPRQKPL